MNIPFTLVGLDHIVFLVDDMKKALEFYQNFLGCHSGYSYPDLGMEQVWVGSSLIVLWDTTHPGGKNARPSLPGGQNVHHVCIGTSPLDHNSFRQHCKNHGVEITQEEFHCGARGMGHSFYLRDPFGNLLEIKGPAEYADGSDRG